MAKLPRVKTSNRQNFQPSKLPMQKKCYKTSNEITYHPKRLACALQGDFLPLRFFKCSGKTASRSAVKFCTSVWVSFTNKLYKIGLYIVTGQLTRSHQVTFPPKMFVVVPKPQSFPERFEICRSR